MNKTEIIKTFLERYESPAENCHYENGNYDFGGRKHDDTVNLLSELVKDERLIKEIASELEKKYLTNEWVSKI